MFSTPKDDAPKDSKGPKRYTSAAERDKRIADLQEELAELQATPVYYEYPKSVNGRTVNSAEEEQAALHPKAAPVVEEDAHPKKAK